MTGCPFLKGNDAADCVVETGEETKESSANASASSSIQDSADSSNSTNPKPHLAEPLVVSVFDPLLQVQGQGDTDTKVSTRSPSPNSSHDSSPPSWANLMSIIQLGHEYLAQGTSRWSTLATMLKLFIKEVGAEYGFFGRLINGDTPDADPKIKIISYTNIAWTPDLQELVKTVQELEFPTVNGGLFAHPLRTGTWVIANDATSHPYYKGLPEGHPPVDNYCGIPMLVGGECVGVIGLANHSNGAWQEYYMQQLMVFTSMLGSLLLLFELRDVKGNLRSHSDSDNTATATTATATTATATTATATTATATTATSTTDSNNTTTATTPTSTTATSTTVTSTTVTSTTATTEDSDDQAKVRISRNDNTMSLKRNETLGEINESSRNDNTMSLKRNETLGEINESSSGKAMKSVDDLHGMAKMEYVMDSHIFNSLSDGLIVVADDVNGSITSCNSAGARILGFESAEALIQEFPFFNEVVRPVWQLPEDSNAVDSDERAKERQVDLATVLNMVRIIRSVEIQCVLQKKMPNNDMADDHQGARPNNDVMTDDNALLVEVDLSISSFETAEGEVFYTCLFRDLSQNKSHNQMVRLLAFLSHEIRNPVQAIISGSQLLVENMESTIAQDVFLAADLLLTVVNDTIDYVRIFNRKFVPNLQNFDVEDVLNSCLRVYTSKCPAGVDKMLPIVDANVPRVVNGDPFRLSQMVGNLYSNASKFTMKGFIKTEVVHEDCTPAQKMKGYDGVLVVKVHDTGCGIKPEDRSELFKFFSRVAATTPNKNLSSGLGLVLSRDIARALDGNVKLLSTDDSGSVFMVTMPYFVEISDEEKALAQKKHASVCSSVGVTMRSRGNGAKSSSPKAVASLHAPGIDKTLSHSARSAFPVHTNRSARQNRFANGKREVLIVDDNPVVMACVRRVLIKQGVSPTDATNGQQAVDIVRNKMMLQDANDPAGEAFDVIFMDLQMPVLDGFETVTQMRKMGYMGRIIALTGNNFEEDTVRAIASGFDEVLIKPVKNSQIVSKLTPSTLSET